MESINPVPFRQQPTYTYMGPETNICTMPPSSGANPHADSEITIVDPIIPTTPNDTAPHPSGPSDHRLSSLPPGCSFESTPPKATELDERKIWVEFPPDSTDNPFYFSRGRKTAIMCVAIFYTGGLLSSKRTDDS